jgi:hypothetical protein
MDGWSTRPTKYRKSASNSCARIRVDLSYSVKCGINKVAAVIGAFPTHRRIFFRDVSVTSQVRHDGQKTLQDIRQPHQHHHTRVRRHPRGKNHAALVSAHLDSTLPSPDAAVHDALSVGVMLDCIRVLTHTPGWTPSHTISFCKHSFDVFLP